MRLPRPVTILILALGLMGVAMLCAVGHSTVERWLGVQNRVGEHEPNPYFAKMNKVAKRHGVNLEQLRVLQRGRGFKLDDSRLFDLEDRQLDVLIVGDSSAVWGVSPSVVSTVSGLRVGIFAYEQAWPTKNFMATVETLGKTYLAENGLVLLCFAPQGWDRPHRARQGNSSLQRLTAMDTQQLEHFIAQKRHPSLFSDAAMAEHWESVEAAVEELPVLGPAQLPNLALYATWVEPWIAPKTARAARANAEDAAHTFYFWDEWNSVLEFCSSCKYELPRDQPPKGKKPTKRMAVAAKEASKLPHRLGFLITFYGDARRSAKLRGLYERELASRAALVDLEAMWPAKLKVGTQGGSHVANEGALYQSLLLGEWLKRFKNGDPNPNRRLDRL